MDPARWLFRLALGQRLPRTSGSLRVNGPEAAIDIRRDRFGIPHIEATNDADAWFGLGFCQGQDRWFQIETLARLTRGTLAELAGEAVVPLDRLSRRIGFRRSAQEQLPVLDTSYREMAEAFAAGANQGLRRGLHRRPHEFLLLRAKPMTIDAADVLGIGKVQSFLIPSNWDSELTRLKILQEDGIEALLALDPAYPADHPITAPPGGAAGAAIDRLASELELLREIAGDVGGSNNWVIGPERTASGRALLANDPHLSPVLPPHWYLAHLKTPEWEVAGAALAGTPGILIGHNEVAAWGITAGFVDNADLYIEQLGTDETSVLRDGEYVACDVRRETIHVRGGTSIVETVAVTHNGPVIGPALEGEPGAISLKATWLQATPVTGVLGMYRAKNMDDVRALAKHWPLASQNVVFADIEGNIGWQLFGDSPVRGKGSGLVPSPGWDSQTGWTADFLVGEDLPSLLNPDEGFIATANNKPRTDGGGYLGADWLDGYRVARIGEALSERDDWDESSTSGLQGDKLSLLWRELQPAIEELSPTSPEAAIGLGLLNGWDGRVAPDSSAACLYELFLAELSRRMVRAKAPRAAKWALGKGFASLLPSTVLGGRRGAQAARLFRKGEEGWFDGGWAAVADESLAAAVRKLQRRFGDDPTDWTWGRVRPLVLRHSIGRRKPLDRVFNRGPFHLGGDSHTVAAAGTNVLDPTDDPTVIASLRMIVEAGDWEGARFSLPGGQSGNPVSPHYDDLLVSWLEGSGVPIAWAPDAVKASTVARLTLSPGRRPQERVQTRAPG